MSQATFDDDDLFGEAAAEMREEVEGHLDAARAQLPDPDEVWETDADNTLGALNGLKSALDVGDAAEELRKAKKSYVVGERADAFEADDDLGETIDDVADLVEDLEAAAEDVGELTGTIPQVRGALQEVDAGAGGGEDDAESDAEGDDGE